MDKSLEDIDYFDAGDLPLPFGNAGRSIEMIGEYVRGLLQDDKFPLGLGGEHLVSWPIIREMYGKYPDLALIHIDIKRTSLHIQADCGRLRWAARNMILLRSMNRQFRS